LSNLTVAISFYFFYRLLAKLSKNFILEQLIQEQGFMRCCVLIMLLEYLLQEQEKPADGETNPDDAENDGEAQESPRADNADNGSAVRKRKDKNKF
jgi:hypothetical protein